MFNEALVCYFQSYSMNPQNEYVTWNLANSFNKLGKVEEAQHWAQQTVADSTSNPWAKEMAAALITSIQEQKAEREAAESAEPAEAEEATEPTEPQAKEDGEEAKTPEPQDSEPAAEAES